ncbi:proline racemase [Cytidiella melzeri]|nr:proline racemase [Cytidiella melzeri]
MDVFDAVGGKVGRETVIKTVDMHTSGEPTRIILPPGELRDERFILKGDTLLEKRAYAREQMDWVRQRMMREPRGHAEMYGAILVAETELTLAGEADIGVLFCHNEGYSTMCGHATIALGRFLLDTADLNVFPRRDRLSYNKETRETVIRLHAPCGIVKICAPNASTGRSNNNKSDSTRRVSFTSVPSFVGGLNIIVEVPLELRWKALKDSDKEGVQVDICYGGAFYAVLTSKELGFSRGIRGCSLSELNEATKTIKDLLSGRKELYAHPSERDLEYLYGVIVTEQLAQKHELGLCFFAEQQVDRSPTGSGVSARVALAHAKGELTIGEEMMFESLVSLTGNGMGFVGKAVEEVALIQRDSKRLAGVCVAVSGHAYYTGAHSFVVEDGDWLGNGFLANTTPS